MTATGPRARGTATAVRDKLAALEREPCGVAAGAGPPATRTPRTPRTPGPRPRAKNPEPERRGDGDLETGGARDGAEEDAADGVRARREAKREAKKLRRKAAKRKRQLEEDISAAPKKEPTIPRVDGDAGRKGRKRPRTKTPSAAGVLVVGDGNFSFSEALGKKLARESTRVLCTSLDTRADVARKYGKPAMRSLEALEAMEHCELLHGVDATNLGRALKGHQFARIVFNFPHTGLQRVHDNRALLRDFFASARDVLAPGGHIEVTLKDGPPYSSWQIEVQADVSGFGLVALRPFQFRDFPGYRHVTTNKEAEPSNPQNACRVYDFMLVRKV